MALVRLQKFLADAGVASRRASELLIQQGAVAVNGKVVTELGTKIDPLHCEVQVKGAPIKAKKKLYVAIHKPRGYICTRRDPEERKTLLDLLPEDWANLYPVGRLDRDSEGLIFATNDGDFCLKITHPRYRIPKIYLALIEGRVTREQLKRFEKGVLDHEEMLKAESTKLVSANNTHSLVELKLLEGKYREVRRLFASEGLRVERLQRVQIGPIKIGELPEGKWRTLTDAEIASLLK